MIKESSSTSKLKYPSPIKTHIPHSAHPPTTTKNINPVITTKNSKPPTTPPTTKPSEICPTTPPAKNKLHPPPSPQLEDSSPKPNQPSCLLVGRASLAKERNPR